MMCTLFPIHKMLIGAMIASILLWSMTAVLFFSGDAILQFASMMTLLGSFVVWVMLALIQSQLIREYQELLGQDALRNRTEQATRRLEHPVPLAPTEKQPIQTEQPVSTEVHQEMTVG